jgi:peptidoglycan/xylan/chitin deacetylase (PgdA/CDA1 family)
MNEPSWIWRQLSERTDAFEQLLRKLRSQNYRTVTLSELYAHMSGTRLCEPKSVALVFDDGYLDNWVTVYPLLKKYDMCGTVYVNPDFVDPGLEARPTLNDYPDSGLHRTDVSQTGFMNWEELKSLDKSGVMDVQSHSLTHTWYFAGPTIIDYYTPDTAAKYPWMAWNARPDRKPYYLQEDQTSFVPWGTPVFEHEKSLLVRQFFPDADRLQDILGSAEKLQIGTDVPGTYETDEDYEARVRGELMQSKRIIEQKLGKTVDFLCWPGGGVNDLARKLAAEVGYKSWTLPSVEKREKRNRPGEDPREIRRLTALRDVRFFDRFWGVGSARLVYLDMLAHQESTAFDVLKKCYKLAVASGVAGQREQR